MKTLKVLVCSILVLWMAAGCGTPHSWWAFQRDRREANRLADAGHYAQALDAFTALSKKAIKQRDLKYLQFRSAFMLEKLNKPRAALKAYAAIYTHPTEVYDQEASRAMYRAGRVYRDLLDEPEEARKVWIAAVRAYPNANDAEDSLQEVERYYKAQKQYHALIELLSNLYVELQDTEIADNLAYDTALVLDEDLDRCEDAIALYTMMTKQFTRSGLVDDAIWRTGLCYRHRGQTDKEYALLKKFVHGRETSVIIGDYNYAQYDPAYMRMAEIHEEQGDLEGAITIYRTYQNTFPLSLKNDDIEYKIITYYQDLGNDKMARKYARELQKLWPESRYVPRIQSLLTQAEADP